MCNFGVFLLIVLHLNVALGDEITEACEKPDYNPKFIKILHVYCLLYCSQSGGEMGSALTSNDCNLDEVFSRTENRCIPSLSFVRSLRLTLSSLLGKKNHKVSHSVELETIKKIEEVLQTQLEGSRSRILHTAVVLNSTDTVRYLLQNKTDLEERDDFGYTALHVACFEGNEDIVKILVEEGHSDVNARNLNNKTALHLATEIGSLSIVKFLFEKGGNMLAKDLDSNNPLHVAAIKGWTNFFEFFLSTTLFDDQEADYINVKNAMNETYLFLATQHKHQLIVKLLSEKGADILVQDEFGSTVLDVAIRHRDIEIVELLLLSPHFTETKNVDGIIQSALTTPVEDINNYIMNILVKRWVDLGAHYESLRIYMHHAITKNLLDVVDIITTQSSLEDINKEIDETTYLHLAVSNRNLKMVMLLVDRGANILAGDVNGNIPLHIAAAQNQLEIVKFLLERNEETLEIKDNHNRNTPMMATLFHSSATLKFLLKKLKDEVVVQDADGMTVFHYACFKNYEDDSTLMHLLLEKFNQTDLQDMYGRTPLHWCSTHDKLETFKLLLSRTPNAGIKDKCGRTPLHLGVESTIELLLNAGMDINEKDLMGRTPLHLASESRDLDTIKKLIENGAKVNEKDLMGRTPLHFASQRCDSNKIEILIENGAKVNARDNEGNTPLHLLLIKAQCYFHDSGFDALIQRGANLLAVNNNGDTAQTLLDNTNDITYRKKLQDSRVDLVALNSIFIIISNESFRGSKNYWKIKFPFNDDYELSTSLLYRPRLNNWLPGSVSEWRNFLGNATKFYLARRDLPQFIFLKFKGSKKGNHIKVDKIQVNFGASHPSPRSNPVYKAYDVGKSFDTESGSELDAKLFLHEPELYCCQNLIISSNDGAPDSILGLYLYDYVKSKDGTTIYVRDSETEMMLYKRPSELWTFGINLEEPSYSFLNSSDVICPNEIENSTITFESGKSASLEMMCESYDDESSR